MNRLPPQSAAIGGLGEKELARLREQTPAWGRFAHFAHGSASLPPVAVHEAWDRWQAAERSMGTLRAMARLEPELQAVRSTVARLVSATPRQVALLDSAGHAWSTAMGALLATGREVHVVTSNDEYGSNSLCLLAAQQRLESRLGITVISARDEPMPLAQRLAEALDRLPHACLAVVSLSVVPTAHGVATNLDGVAEVVRQRKGLLFVDASHAVGQLPVDVKALGSDVLVFPARKWLRGPKGAAVLVVSDQALERLGTPPGVDVAGAQWTAHATLRAAADARRFEGHEFNPGLRLALGAACEEVLRIGPGRIAQRNAEVRALVTDTLRERLGWVPLEGAHPRATALMTYALPPGSGDGRTLVRMLWEVGVNVSAVGLQYARWALEAEGVPAVLRLTPHFLTGEDELERLVKALGG